MRVWIVVSGVIVATGSALLYAGVREPQTAKPSTIRHHIVTGDTLGDIALHYGTTTRKLRIDNGIDGETIYTGRVLRVTPSATWWKGPTAEKLRGLVAPAGGFDFPVGAPDGKGYYNAQPFGDNNHLGDDWNGTGGGNTDLGDPVYSAADGIVISQRDRGAGWGNVVRVVHNAGTAAKPMYVETLYAHLDKIHVARRQKVSRGEKIGTIGTAGGKYPAHLHFEIRSVLDSPLGRGYSTKTAGYLDPTTFINKRRP